MSEPFIAEVRIFAGNFAPRGWAFCDGQLLPIAQHTAVFSLVGTTYGGNGRTDFALPNLKARGPMGPGNGPGLSRRRLGEKTGAAEVALSAAEVPAHTHSVPVSDDAASTDPQNRVFGLSDGNYAQAADFTNLAPQAVGNAGGNQPHQNMQPYLALNFIFALQGLYPSRS